MIGNNFIDLGCVGHCDVVNTDICIQKAGTYYLGFELDNVKRYVEIITTVDGENLSMPMVKFPIDREMYLKLLDSNMEVMSDGEYNIIRIKSIIKLTEE